MKKLLAATVALGALTSMAVAEDRVPTKLTAAQMDSVTAGNLIDIDVRNVLNRNNVDVRVVDLVDANVRVRNVNVSAAAAIAVLGAAGAASGAGN